MTHIAMRKKKNISKPKKILPSPPPDISTRSNQHEKDSFAININHAYWPWLFLSLSIFIFFSTTEKANLTNQCLVIFKVADFFEFIRNCDFGPLEALIYDHRSTDFKDLLHWKDRPVYIALGYIFSPLAFIIDHLIQPLGLSDMLSAYRLDDRGILQKYTTLNPKLFDLLYITIAYYMTHILITLAAIYLAIRMIGLQVNNWLAIALVGALASHDLVEAGLWMVHTNIFNFVFDIFIIWGFIIGYENYQKPLNAKIILFACIVAAGLLTYPKIIIAIAMFLIGQIIAAIANKDNDNGKTGYIIGKNEIEKFIFMSAIAFMPFMIWNLYLKLWLNLTPHDVLLEEYNQFQWFINDFNQGVLLSTFFERLINYITSQLALIFPLSLFIVCTLGMFLLMGWLKIRQLSDYILMGCLFGCLGIWGFNFLQGYNGARLTIGVLLASYIFIARLGVLANKQSIAAVILLTVMITQLYLAISGPTISLK
ncbi:MAG: hypothetical protein AAF403_05540 [Pseudomonadota bacterium]